MRSYTEDRRRVDRFEPQIKAILGEHLIATADFERDTKQATDLLVLSVKPITVACRIRTWGYTASYSEEFTIRAERPNGMRTELRKIYEGWCRYGFYGFAGPDDERVVWWTLYDLDLFRRELKSMPDGGMGLIKERLQSNEDGSSRFAAFKWTDFKMDIRVAWRRPALEPCPAKDCWHGKVMGQWSACPTCKGLGHLLAEGATR